MLQCETVGLAQARLGLVVRLTSLQLFLLAVNSWTSCSSRCGDLASCKRAKSLVIKYGSSPRRSATDMECSSPNFRLTYMRLEHNMIRQVDPMVSYQKPVSWIKRCHFFLLLHVGLHNEL